MNKTKVIQVRVTPEMLAELERIAEQHDVTRSVVARWALRAWLENRRDSSTVGKGRG